MKTNFKFIIVALFTLALTSCSPEDGKDGTNGEQGIPGEDGNANVTSYLFKNIVLEEGMSDPFQIPAITRDILDNGAILAYIRGVGASEWYPLPYLFADIHINVDLIDEGILVINSTAQTNILDIRIVVIKGNPGNGGKSNEGQSSSQAIFDTLKAAGVDINDYDAVVDYYNIKN